METVVAWTVAVTLLPACGHAPGIGLGEDERGEADHRAPSSAR
jgi:hypothetical protein